MKCIFWANSYWICLSEGSTAARGNLFVGKLFQRLSNHSELGSLHLLYTDQEVYNQWTQWSTIELNFPQIGHFSSAYEAGRRHHCNKVDPRFFCIVDNWHKIIAGKSSQSQGLFGLVVNDDSHVRLGKATVLVLIPSQPMFFSGRKLPNFSIGGYFLCWFFFHVYSKLKFYEFILYFSRNFKLLQEI